MTDLDRVTDLFEKWAAEENEHRQAGEYGLAEGLRVAIEDLRTAVHGGRAETTTATDEDAEALALRLWDEGIVRPEHVAMEAVEAVLRWLAEDGLLATARTRPTETTTEWAVRWGDGTVQILDDADEPWDEWTAKEYVEDCVPSTAVVRREVTPWIEADR